MEGRQLQRSTSLLVKIPLLLGYFFGGLFAGGSFWQFMLTWLDGSSASFAGEFSVIVTSVCVVGLVLQSRITQFRTRFTLASFLIGGLVGGAIIIVIYFILSIIVSIISSGDMVA